MNGGFCFQLPSLAELCACDSDVQMRRIRGYLYQLTQQLQFVLNHLDTDNFTADTAHKITAAADENEVRQQLSQVSAQSRADFRTALARIIESAQEVNAHTSAQMNVLSDRIEAQVAQSTEFRDDVSTSVHQLTSQVTQNASDLTAAFTRMARMEDAVGGFQAAEFSTYIRFDEDGIWLGRSDSDFSCRLTNERLSFLQGSRPIAYVSNNRLHIADAAVYGTLSVTGAGGSYDFHQETNGSLSLVFRP